MENISIYSEARNEYLKQLSTWIVPPLVEFFRTEYDRLAATEGRSTMRAFQTFCSEVPRWNQDVITTHINGVLDNCRCDYIEELMTAVFVAHTKMLTAIRVSTKQKKLSITLPKLDHFLHRVFTECARSFWKAPFLFAHDLTAVEKQKNILQAESMCIDAVQSAVRSLLPVKNILRDYLDESDSEEEAPVVVKKKGKTDPVPPPVEDSDSDSSSSSEDEAPAAAPVVAAVPEKKDAPVGPFSAQPLNEAITGEDLEEPTPAPAPAPAPVPVVIEKLDTPPTPSAPTESKHEVKEVEVKRPVTVEKMDETSADPPKLMIDTEPAVHFTPYDTVFDENKPGVSEIRYAEKVSVEDKPPSNWGMFDDDDDDVPKIEISGESSSLGGDDIEDLDAPPLIDSVSAVTPDEDVNQPLGATLDFESLE